MDTIMLANVWHKLGSHLRDFTERASWTADHDETLMRLQRRNKLS